MKGLSQCLQPRWVAVLITTIVLVFIWTLVGQRSVASGHDDHQPETYSLANNSDKIETEPGLFNFTVVTALVDIGRGNWSKYTRTYETYLSYMQRVLRLRVNMIIYIEAKGRAFVESHRKGLERHTFIVEVTLDQLPHFQLKARVQEIMNTQEYQKDNVLFRLGNPEAHIPEYNMLQWSKLFFVKDAIYKDVFSNTYYIWLDAGYGHGEDIHPPDGIWVPMNLFEHADQITFIEREPVEKYRPDAQRLHKMNINIVAGLFFGGGKMAFQRLFVLHQELIADWLKQGTVVDDDQTTYMLMYYREPKLFNLVRGDWNDVFKLFNSHNSTIPSKVK